MEFAMGHEFISCIPIMVVKVFISGSKVTDFFPPEPKETLSRADTTQFLQLKLETPKSVFCSTLIVAVPLLNELFPRFPRVG